LKRHVLWTIAKIKSIIEGERIPREASPKKCRNCGYRKVCKGVWFSPVEIILFPLDFGANPYLICRFHTAEEEHKI